MYKKLLPLWFLCFLLLCTTKDAVGQYKNSAGIRVGYTNAITYKHFTKNEQAFELLASSRNNGFQLTFLYSNHKPMEVGFNENFYFHYGIGSHVGYEKRREYRAILNPQLPDDYYVRDKSTFVLGVDAMFGIEYRWLAVPMTFGLDFKPYFDYVGWKDTNFRFWDMAITFKYIF